MNEPHHENLLGGAIGETTQAAAQLATILAAAAQTALRLQTRRYEVDRAADQAAADVQRMELRRQYTAARLDWAPALQPAFKTSASTTHAATVWHPPSHGSTTTRQLGKPPASPRNASASSIPS